MSRPKHRTKAGATYFVTTNTWQRRVLFHNLTSAKIVVEKLFEYRDKGSYLVHSYVVMPEHLHVILTPGEATTLEKAVQLIKGGSAYDIRKKLQLRFPVWQTGFTEHQIRDQRDFDIHVGYINGNPVKARLALHPHEYRFCSASGIYRLDAWVSASGAEAQTDLETIPAGLKPRPS